MRTVLVIAAHADDEVLGVGGTIARHVTSGDQVHVVIVSNRIPYKFGVEEKIHAVEARHTLGYKTLRFLDLDDMDLDGKLIHIIEPLEKAYNDISPCTVYTHHHGDNNQDHRAVFDASMVVCRPQHKPPARFYSYEVPSSTDQAVQDNSHIFTPNHYVQLTHSHLRKKIRAMNKYKNQTRRYPDSSRSSKGIDVLARYRGAQSVAEFSEAFILLRSIQ